MATRSRYLFVTPSEYTDWLAETTEALKLRAIVCLRAVRSLEGWDGTYSHLERAEWVFIAPVSASIGHVDGASVILAKVGWMQSEVPRVSGSTLFALQIAAKSDWYEKVQRQIMRDLTSIKLFDRFWRAWRKHFTMSMYGINVATGGFARYVSMGCSRGAMGWVRKGGRLRQAGVNNIEFAFEEPQS